jgi:hypothetical protein
VLNGCRSALRRRVVRRGVAAAAAGPAAGPPLSLTAAGEEKEDWRSGPLTHRGRHHSNAHFADVDAGMLNGGHHTPLPWSENTFTAAW